MDFQAAENQFRYLEKRYQAGQISLEEYRAELLRSGVHDRDGNLWQMQEGSGTWHVYKQGKWTPASPPSLQAKPVENPAQAGYQNKPMEKLQGSRKISPWIIGGGILGLLLVCTILLCGGILLLSRINPLALLSGRPSGSSSQTIKFTITGSSTISADGKPVTDAQGVSVTVPSGALPSGVNAKLTTLQMEADAVSELTQAYKLETTFYEVTSDGAEDGTARAEIDFPAPSQDSRLLVVIDNEYMSLQNVIPENGKLKALASLSPNNQTTPDINEPSTSQGNVYYAVITPKSGISFQEPSNLQQVGWALPQGTGIKNCDPFANTKNGPQLHRRGNCRTNAAGTVQVVWRSSLGLTEAEGDLLVEKTAEIMGSYSGLGFRAAGLNGSYPVFVAVETKAAIKMVISEAGAFYLPTNGVVHMPIESVRNLQGKDAMVLAHELAHWVQDEGYDMVRSSGNFGPNHWWWEVSAENMVMLSFPDYIKESMDRSYENTPVSLQTSPFGLSTDWLTYYVQAQLVKVNMCDNPDCPLSVESFISAINQGTYPYKDANVQYMATNNMDDYARYLVGAAPRMANSGISLIAVQEPISYGEKANVVTKGANKFSFGIDTTTQNQIVINNTSGTYPELDISAQIQKDAVYAVELGNGFSSTPVNLPGQLVIPAGPPFWYRLDNGDPILWDGKTSLTIGPISNSTTFGGYRTVRLVAYNEQDDTVIFKASLRLIDLTGTWIIEQGNQTSGEFRCVDSQGKDVTEAVTNAYGFTLLTNVVRAEGELNPTEDTISLNWTVLESRVPSESDPSLYTFQSFADIGTEGIDLEDVLDIPQPDSGGNSFLPEMRSAAIAGLLPIAWVMRFIKKEESPRLVDRWSVTHDLHPADRLPQL